MKQTIKNIKRVQKTLIIFECFFRPGLDFLSPPMRVYNTDENITVDSVMTVYSTEENISIGAQSRSLNHSKPVSPACSSINANNMASHNRSYGITQEVIWCAQLYKFSSRVISLALFVF